MIPRAIAAEVAKLALALALFAGVLVVAYTAPVWGPVVDAIGVCP